MKKKIICAALVLTMLLGVLLVSAFAASGTDGKQTVLDVTYGNIVIGNGTVEGYSSSGAKITTHDPDGYVITGSSIQDDTRKVQVSGNHKITIRDLYIDVSWINYAAAFNMDAGNLELTLEGTNYLASGRECAGLTMNDGANVTITAESTGILNAVGGVYCFGIGVRYYGNCGNLTIHGGYITGGFKCGGKVTIDGGHFGPHFGLTEEANTIYTFKVADGCKVIKSGSEEFPNVVYKGTTVGPFYVMAEGGVTSSDYSWSNNVLTILSERQIAIMNVDQSKATTAGRIFVPYGVSANIVLAGVNIDQSGTGTLTENNLDLTVPDQSGVAAFEIEYWSTGHVTVTLADGTVNTLKSGVCCAGLQKNGYVYKSENSDSGLLDITGCASGTGILNAYGGFYGAGIGGGEDGNTGNITITGCTVNAYHGDYASGIGSGFNADARDLTFVNCKVTAEGALYYPAIGGGDCEYITIINSDIYADGGRQGAGIGSGDHGDAWYITIQNSTVVALGGTFGAGIGGGNKGNAHYISIVDSIVTATGGSYGAGIGGGDDETCTSIVIEGGSVKAIGGEEASALGGGRGGYAMGTTNLGDQEVFLLTVSNPDNKTVYVDGVAYPVRQHSDEDTNLYLHLSRGEHYIDAGERWHVKYYSHWAEPFLPEHLCSKDAGGDGKCDDCGADVVQVTLDANGGSGTMETEAAKADGTYLLPICSFVAPEGKGFIGWSTAPDGSVISDLTTSFTEATTLYAIWNDQAAVSFDANGGTGKMVDVVVFVGESYTLPVCGFVAPDSYRFKGWASSPNGAVISEKSIIATTNMTLYAIWEECYTVSFDANGGIEDTDEEMEPVTGLRGTYDLPACRFYAPTGKQFKGWAYTPDGEVITTDTIEVMQDLTLYAIWMDDYIVTFDPNGATGSMNPVYADGGNYYLPKCSFTVPEGWSFKGWSTRPDGRANTGYYWIGGNTTFYAIWSKPLGDTVGNQTVLDVSKGNITLGDGTVDAYAPDGTHITEYDPDGFVITGYSEEDAKKVNIISGSHRITIWDLTINVYYINYAPAFNIENGAHVDMKLMGNCTLKSGWDCAGITLAGADASLTITADSTGHLYADGSNTVGIGARNGGTSGTITINGGYIESDEIGGDSHGAIIINGGCFAQGSLENQTVYGFAVAEDCFVQIGIDADCPYEVIGPATITFDSNGGTGTMDSVKVDRDSSYTLPECTFTAPTGMKFIGWALSADGVGIVDDRMTVTEDITFYAVWEACPDGIQTVLDVSRGYIVIRDGSVDGYAPDGTHITIPDPDGYILTGYSTSDNKKVQIYGTHKITLRDLTVDVSGTNWAAAFAVGGTVEMTLEGENILRGGIERAGLNIYETGSVTITAESTGTLIASSESSEKYAAAAIGSNERGDCGAFIVKGGSISAVSGGSGADAIGAGKGGSVLGPITVSGGRFAVGDAEAGTVYGIPVAKGYKVVDHGSGTYRYEVVCTEVSVTAKGNISYTVSGNTVTVTHTLACKVGYLDGDKYVAVAATPNPDGSYSFTAPEGVTEVVIVIKGDVNGDGRIRTNDASMAKAIYLGKDSITPTAEQIFAADANGDGRVRTNDASMIKSVYLGKNTFVW